MSRFAAFAFLVAMPEFLWAHPMGNFSVNHYSRLNVTTTGVQMDYVLDLAEIPSLELLHNWNLQRDSSRAELEARAASQARVWLANLTITANHKPVAVRFISASLFIGDGAANLPVMRISTRASLSTSAGDLKYEDFNYPDRAGWKEVVIAKTGGVTLKFASQTDQDSSSALTRYPADPTLSPPQDLRAEIAWMVEPAARSRNLEKNITSSAPARTIISPVPQPHRAPAPVSPAALAARAAPPGTVVRGDFLSRLLHRGELAPWMILLAMAAAFGLGAMHALTPGHGKTIVAAYLVGSRGTMKHAAFLGATVTFTHTISVFALGIATLFFFRYIVPEKLVQILGVISGLSIVAVGCWMARQRLQSFLHLRKHALAHAHSHPHTHSQPHGHSHTHAHNHGHTHPAGHAHAHSHVPEELSWSGLFALGIGGGLVPCESALVLMLSAIALGRVAFGLLLLLSFSVGLAVVLMAVGAAVLYSKKLIGRSTRIHDSPAFHWLPLASAAAVIVVGLIMTGVSAGVLRPSWLV